MDQNKQDLSPEVSFEEREKMFNNMDLSFEERYN